MARAKPKDKQTEPSYLKVPPQNIEAEQAILGAILIHNDAMNQVVDVVTPEDFYREAHAAIFEGMVSLYHQGDPIDIITIAQFLTKKGLLENIGGAEYLASLVEAVSTSAGIAHYAEMVKDNAIRRKLIGQCSTISDACFQPWENTDDLLDQAEQSIFDIAEQRVREGFDPLKEVIKTSFAKARGRRLTARATSRACPRTSGTSTGSRPGFNPPISSSSPAAPAWGRPRSPSTSATTPPP